MGKELIIEIGTTFITLFLAAIAFGIWADRTAKEADVNDETF